MMQWHPAIFPSHSNFIETNDEPKGGNAVTTVAVFTDHNVFCRPLKFSGEDPLHLCFYSPHDDCSLDSLHSVLLAVPQVKEK
jgi:hypothetical protein